MAKVSGPTLTIMTHATTHKILFNGKQAIGVEYLQGAKSETTYFRSMPNKEVLLCAGAIASPQILQRSGVGF